MKALMNQFLAWSFVASMAATGAAQTTQQPELGTRVAKVLRVDGLLFKDLNKNDKLDKYED